MSPTTVLLVDDDEVLGQVLTRVLTQQGHTVQRATDAAQALQLAHEQPPQLALLDLCLPDQDGIELAQKLRSDNPGLPLILMTAYPLQLRDHPERMADFACVLTKPLNVQELRQAVEAALHHQPVAPRPVGPAPQPEDRPPARRANASPSRVPELPPVVPPAAVPLASPSRSPLLRRIGVVAAAVVVAGLLGTLLLFGFIHSGEPTASGGEQENSSAALVPGKPDTLRLPPGVVERLGIQVVQAEKPTRPRTLELDGSLALDANHLARVHSRFPGEIAALDQKEGLTERFAVGHTVFRPIQFGDPVRGPHEDKDGKMVPGEVLAVVWSKDLGEKKSELVDAVSQLRADQDQLEKLEAVYQQGATSEASVRMARRAVEQDLNAIARARRTLRAWRLTDEEIKAVEDEADRIATRRKQGIKDKSWDDEPDWAKVEVRAPFDGVVVEKNVAVGDIVDTTTDLFKIADIARLQVWAHAYEEDLPELRSLTAAERHWSIRLKSDPSAPPIEGTFERPGFILDPNQHTALVMGDVPNPDEKLRAGQFVTATVKLSAPKDVVAIPSSALVDEGDESIVFVQEDSARPEYTLRRVAVTKRMADQVYIRTEVSAEQAARGVQPLQVGDRVVTQGAVEMKGELDDLKESGGGQR
jgi:cobalt-zinc-cadmium efflux system membrane fusion protein